MFRKSFWFLIATLIPSLALGAAFKTAEFTKVQNDVKMLPESEQPKPAKVGDVVQGRTSVTTGSQSRAELRFDDKSITRLGSNSVFNLEQGSRTVDLKQGVLLMQVPKQMGGAKVRTASITAAVTGTTLMVEYQPDGYVKIIVLEGEVDVFRNDKPDVFRTIHAGDMIIMKPDGQVIPEPVQVDLQRLKKTSKLTDEREFGSLGNQKHLMDADMRQDREMRRGNLGPTNLRLPGRGPMVEIQVTGRDPHQLRGDLGVRNPNGGPPPEGDPHRPGGPGDAGGSGKFGKPPVLGGVAVIDDETQIITDPEITTGFSGTLATGQGKIYRPGTDGTLGRTMFNKPTLRLGDSDLGPLPAVDQRMADAGAWTAFNFTDLHVIGAPDVITQGGPKNLLLASQADITLSNFDPYSESSFGNGSWDLTTSTLNDVMLAANGDIDWRSGMSIVGTNQNLSLYSQTGDINLSGDLMVNLISGVFEANAARNLNIYGSGGQGSESPSWTATVQAKNVNLSAEGDVTIGPNAIVKASEAINIRARGNISVLDSSQLRRLSSLSTTELNLIAEQGNVNVGNDVGGTVTINTLFALIESQLGNITLTNSSINSDYLRVHTLATNGTLTIGNSSLTASQGMKLYAEGSNGRVQFVGNTTLSGPAIVAGYTVQVNDGVTVNVGTPNSFHVHSDISNYNKAGYGNFSRGGTPLIFVPDGTTGPHQHNFSSRPAF
ncbi:MAG: FecR domain-containing protein [Verrucomicrobiaceae bacterium]|nr:FecR domain-containing protein [Verrucomicrobiaceae bacterium]